MVAGASKLKSFKKSGGKKNGKEQRDIPSPSPVIQRKQRENVYYMIKLQKKQCPPGRVRFQCEQKGERNIQEKRFKILEIFPIGHRFYVGKGWGVERCRRAN